MIETSVLGWIIGSVFFSSLFIMLIALYNKHEKNIPRIIFTLLGLGGPLISLLLSSYLIYQQVTTGEIFHFTSFVWLDVEGFYLNAAFLLDPLSAAMLSFVSFVGFVIHVYAHVYMDEEEGYVRFFAWFNLFMASMFLLILGDNPFMLFIGWEGVGLCSYLLISFYFSDENNVKAGNKAFILNRIGDFGFISGLALLSVSIGALGLDFASLEANIHLIDQSRLNLIAFLLFVGAMGKSAQIPLYIWLPDAMAGPTPVSALIHAATMVTAGVYMVARFHFIFSSTEEIGLFIAYIGAFSAMFAAFIATRQDDIKKVLAYSTMSQLGYMFMAVGLGAYSAGIFHVFIHAFFKALLFMSAGAIILSLHHEQDMKKMGGLLKKMPLIFAVMLIATLSISGIPPFSGFFSKDTIITHLFSSGHYLIYGIAVFTAALTSYYMFRLIFMVFISPAQKEHPPLVPTKNLMLITLVILSIGATFAGLINLPSFFGGQELYSMWLNLPDMHYPVSHTTESILLAINLIAAGTGILIAYIQYAKTSDESNLGYFATLCKNKFYVDELLYALIAKPIGKLSMLINFIDKKVIDAFIHKISNGYVRLCYYSDSVQDGNVRSYALYMSIGIVTIFIYAWGVS